MTEPIHVEVQGGTPPPTPPQRGSLGLLMFVPGLFFIGLGVLVLVWPDMLKLMVSAAFIMVGMGLCVGALQMRRVGRQISAVRQQFPPN